MSIGRTIICLLVALLLASPALGQATEVPKEMAGTGFFRDQDTLPGAFRFYRQLPGGEGGLWGLGPTRQKISHSSFKMDAHDGQLAVETECARQGILIPEISCSSHFIS